MDRPGESSASAFANLPCPATPFVRAVTAARIFESALFARNIRPNGVAV